MNDAPLSDDARPTGRPTKFAAETVERLCAAIGDGMPIKGACTVAGIGVTTLNEWREKYPNLEERIVDARENARLKGLQAIKAAGDKDWRAWAEFLRLTFPADYRGSGGKIAISATAVSSGPIMTEERLHELQEIRQRLLREQNAENAGHSPEPQ
jgi:hypothetical protein